MPTKTPKLFSRPTKEYIYQKLRDENALLKALNLEKDEKILALESKVASLEASPTTSFETSIEPLDTLLGAGDISYPEDFHIDNFDKFFSFV
ncbi:hypothetical protein LTR37_020712 [Vermiconidia calcicola]|uniref:Uncharacterized protein n=1 Tax=Vermiconidia calcicola TaxID=1690605 RepID=A0ACC3MAF6_9PEZI|nr:hypothetical protein LTR37_020712 [Vermiconidia calcicola]